MIDGQQIRNLTLEAPQSDSHFVHHRTSADRAVRCGGFDIFTAFAPFIDVRAFGTLGTADDAVTIQAAIDYASTLSTGGTVVVPAGNFNVGPIFMQSRVNFMGQGRATRLVAIAGSTIGMLQLSTTSTERFIVQDLWLEGNLAVTTLSGIHFDNTGGVLSGGGTEIVVRNVTITNPGIHGVYLIGGQATKIFQTRVRSAALDGIVIDATDCQVVQCSLSPTGRYGLHLMQHVNMAASLKIGETASHGVYIAATSFSNSLSAIAVDNVTGDAYHVLGNNNIIAGSASRPSGNAVYVDGDHNMINIVATVQGGTMPYAVNLGAGAASNTINATTQQPVSGLIAGPVTANNVTVNGVSFSETLPITRWTITAGTPIANTSTGLRVGTFNLAANGDEVAGHAFYIPSSWRSRKLAVSLAYSVATGDNTKAIEWSIGLSGLAVGNAVTALDLAYSRVTTAPAVASIVETIDFILTGEQLTLGASDVEGSITIKRGASTTLTGAIHVHHVYVRIVG